MTNPIIKRMLVLFLLLGSIANALNLNTNKEVFSENEKITVTFNGVLNRHKDWVAIYPATSSNAWKNVISWKWTKNRKNGKLTFHKLPAGEYEVRIFFNNSYKAEIRKKFTVTTTTHSTGVHTNWENVMPWAKKPYGHRIQKKKEFLGSLLFFDPSLSKNYKMSCATCHNPFTAFVDKRFKFSYHPVHGAVSVGTDGIALGGRNTPTAAYAMFSPPFHYDNATQRYVGGQFYDGRASTLKDQAMGPPTNPVEMQMPDKKSVVSRIKKNYFYKWKFKKIFGRNIFKNTDKAYEAMAEAIEAYEKTKTFAPFDSKYDRFLDCKDTGKTDEMCYTLGHWTKAEIGGMKGFFNNPKISCKNCHMLKTPRAKGETFSNYSYFNIGTPKNMELIHKLGLSDNYVDHGIYGRDDISDSSLDGAMKVPTLRNVAVTAPYMTNGVFKNLKTVLEFYLHVGSPDSTSTDPRPINPETGKAWGEPNVANTINHDLLNLQVKPDVFLKNMEAFLRTLTDRRYEYLLK